MRLYAFQGLRYDRPAAEIDRLAAPPYDQIDQAKRDALHAVSAHQFTHLTVPVADGGGDPYAHSKRLHEAWRGEGLVCRDRLPALYPYVVELAGGGQRLGICGLVGLEPPGSGVILEHEATLAKPLADRVALLEANRIDLEPVLMLADDDGALDRLVATDAAAGPPLAEHTDEGGHRHLLYRVEEPQRIAAYRQLMEPLAAAIADGHHRYKTARLVADKLGAAPGTAGAAKMAVISSLASPGLAIDPIHRGLEQAVDPAAVAALLAGCDSAPAPDGRGFAAAVAAAEQPAIGLWPAGGSPEIWRFDPAKAPASIPEGARALPVALLHGAVFPALGLAPEAATDGTVRYRSDPERLAAELTAGKLATGLFLPPMDPAAFAAAIAGGDLLPPKSTRFLPKLVSGLVWTDHDAALA